MGVRGCCRSFFRRRELDGVRSEEGESVLGRPAQSPGLAPDRFVALVIFVFLSHHVCVGRESDLVAGSRGQGKLLLRPMPAERSQLRKGTKETNRLDELDGRELVCIDEAGNGDSDLLTEAEPRLDLDLPDVLLQR